MSDQVCRYDLSFLGFGRWGNVDDVATKILKRLNSWMMDHREYLWEYMAYVCPTCGYVVRGSQVDRALSKPVWCPLHGIKMIRYIPELFEEDTRLFERFKDQLIKKLMLLEIAAKRYVGRPPEKWRLYFPPTVEAAFGDNDPTVFRYAWWRNAIEAYLHRLDQEHHHETLSHLRRFVVGFLGLEFCAEINPRHMNATPPGAVYDKEKDVYRIAETRHGAFYRQNT